MQAIPFLMLLLNHVKDWQLTAPVWGGHAHITRTVDWDSPKGDVSQFVRMAQDHMCYNMSVVSAEVHGIMDLGSLDKRYLEVRRIGEQWSSIKVPCKEVNASEMGIWRRATAQVVE